MKPVVLVVDDDTAICALLQDVLSEHVFTVSVCHTGQEAISRVEGDPDIALVVLDMMLPDTNGLRVLQQLQKMRPALPVVMLTGLGSESDVVVGLEMGADDYICKPFTPRVVVARLKAVLRRVGALAVNEEKRRAVIQWLVSRYHALPVAQSATTTCRADPGRIWLVTGPGAKRSSGIEPRAVAGVHPQR